MVKPVRWLGTGAYGRAGQRGRWLSGGRVHHLKLSLVGLIGALVALFSVGRLDQPGFDVAVTPAGVHLITAILVIALVVSRLSFNMSSTVLVAGVAVGYVASRAFVHDPDAVRTGASALLTAIEIALASVSILLAVRVSRGLNQFEESIANITLEELPGVTTLAAARDDIAIEMSRARRHERPLTVTVLSFDPRAVHASLHEIVRDVQRRMMQRYIMSGLARVAAQTTRRGDIVVQDPAANRVIVLSPESSPAQLEALTQRLQESACRSLGIPVRFGSAGFPTTALTFEDLVAHASGDAAIDQEVGIAEQRPRKRTGFGAEVAAVTTMRSLYRDVDDAPAVASHIREPVHAVHGD